MNNIFLLIQIAISVILITLILLQPKGVGLGKAWGGSGVFYKSKRGVEKVVFYLTIFFVVIFLISSILSLLLA
ncbi:preprotein translocase subunit SecG [Candidatus Gottesmanbacteria bacterium]|nr:preprotein translocase subunit SecG [Candidatus Gottesmanbacteria bacterium]